MKTRVKTEIIVETRRVLTIINDNRDRFAWCSECRHQTQMVSADQAALLHRVSSRDIYLKIEAHELHFNETPEGRLLICANSLKEGAPPEK